MLAQPSAPKETITDKTKKSMRVQKLDPKKKRRNAIKEAIGQLIGPTEVDPSVMILIKELTKKQKALANDVHTCTM